MDSTTTRRCRICKMPLSEYNLADVCFCHKEHPDPALNGVLNPIDHGFQPYGPSLVEITWKQEYAASPLLEWIMKMEWERRLFH